MYTRQLCQALLEKNRALDLPHHFVLATSGRPVFSGNGASSHALPAIRKPSRLQWALDRWILPRFLSESRLDLFHATDFVSIPRSGRARVLAHVHDMIPFIFWKEYSRRIPADYRWALQQARRHLHYAERIITDSFHSRRDIAELTGYPEERIHVVPLGPAGTLGAPAASGAPAGEWGDAPAGESEDTALSSPVPEGSPYFLYVGETDFRKNVPFLVRSFGAFSQRHRDVRLVLVGETFLLPELPEVMEVHREAERCGLANRLQMPGFVSARRLRQLYSGALALVFPSLYEGFGLPVLEAMASGAPVLAARTSSIPEVLGDTGLYFDPRREESLIAAMEAIDADSSLRSQLAARARQRAAQFSWEKAADAVFEIYRQLE
ncbi:MAG: glycosyltransferase family 4 protein [Acidobacteria bacterium]|nr:glycosyltransferase family 4 protein [Acidobacteriota bacterium]